MADFLRDGVDANSVYIGAMAQDLLDLVPEAVVTNPKTGYYDVDYSMIDVDFLKVKRLRGAIETGKCETLV